MKPIIYVTTNLHKLEELRRHVDLPLVHKPLELPEIQSLDPIEVAIEKAKAAFQIVQSPVLVEDVSVVFHAMGNLPGPFIKWFWTELGLEVLCRMLDQYPDRSATCQVTFGLYDGKTLKTFVNKRKGTIAQSPKGSKSSGWNPIFIPDGQTKTWAEMDFEEQMKTSMRRPALKQLEKYLSTLI